jgi:threonyl-tRNA synthetase
MGKRTFPITNTALFVLQAAIVKSLGITETVNVKTLSATKGSLVMKCDRELTEKDINSINKAAKQLIAQDLEIQSIEVARDQVTIVVHVENRI